MGDHVEVFAFRPENVKLDFCVEDATVTKLYRGNGKIWWSDKGISGKSFRCRSR